ncbi:A/G-specific adenine glycosylase [Novosphingobium endophyticum]|uniref:Adenine DNA glycosylase n=1 Tax=Novosphingobium endophyticum TaxID=1955250 RepID=A0A916X6S4_9SPHN|nr:A/G-specific adenine glycosylase [Novosphingobium endophyticum]GGC11171.1 A/G-specific adenine glycosylase [Novosphingobium endophyticum]
MEASSDTIPRKLLDWYDAHARDLPWRARPGTEAPDPYRVWLSEVMLQQTTVAAVRGYYAEFTRRWPTVEELAAAADEEVMAAWAGLGYYARARNLLACAREVAARGGEFPGTEEGLRALPGLGAYTAAAVAAIAFGRRAVVVDANVERVVARLFALDEPLPGGRAAIREKADAITPATRGGDFAQAMMDLGATVCTSRSPRCLLCPLAARCAARALGEPGRFPVKAPKKARPARRGRAFWIECDERVWLVRRPGRGMLGGMRALPDDGWHSRADGSGEGPLDGPWGHAGKVAHVFTHFALELQLAVYLGDRCDSLGAEEGEWWPLDRLEEAGLPTLFAKAARLALADTGELA